ncbi:hypothetical protein TEU_05545 [Thermococcus eurythermalis]|uniref:Uncharacterized protein n=1 Tax=Thermococcus eurythermalis TaxID=1505907 RepID=A0A097QTM0_9EURY|nr:N-6 DNA methylase [Thermococcus eurythermalis]AIU69836.1 hypothetical protein TEU_05545 [Thermococcus eurythermalis]
MTTSKVPEAYRAVKSNPKLLSLWLVSKEIADNYGIRDFEVDLQSFHEQERPYILELLEIRKKLPAIVDRTSVEQIKARIHNVDPADLYINILNVTSRRAWGQFWTPDRIAEWMIAQTIAESSEKITSIFDVGSGGGAFLKKGYTLGIKHYYGIEKSPILLDILRYQLTKYPFRKYKLILGDFLLKKDLPSADLWISNPPYTRHHALGDLKEVYLENIKNKIRITPPKKSSLFVYFVLNILGHQRLWKYATIITPRLIYDSISARRVKKFIITSEMYPKRLDIFDNQNVFPDADVGAVISYFDSLNKPDKISMNLCKINNKIEIQLKKNIDVKKLSNDAYWTMLVYEANLSFEGIPLKEVFKIMRGVATGANSYFLLSEEELRKFGLPRDIAIPAISRSRDVKGMIFTKEDWENLKNKGKKVYLIDLTKGEHDINVRKYIKRGEEEGIPQRSLVKTRNPWYKLEKRDPPAIFVSYLSRGRPKFVLNDAKVVPLNSFLCLYPKIKLSRETLVNIVKFLNGEEVQEQLRATSKNYGENTIKLEPRELDKILLPPEILDNSISSKQKSNQKTLFEIFEKHKKLNNKEM